MPICVPLWIVRRREYTLLICHVYKVVRVFKLAKYFNIMLYWFKHVSGNCQGFYLVYRC